MSGVVGWVDARRDLREHTDTVCAMTATMGRRGPDGTGVWVSRGAALGHRLLAVTPGAAAEPAVAVRDGAELAAVVDGAIDNLDELCIALAGERPSRPAEVVLAAYLRWGDAFVERLDGIFAFVVWDGRDRRLLLGRDRLGITPLYYAAHPGGVLVASEPKGILANPLFAPRLDLGRLPLLLQPRLALPGETPLEGLHEVPAAHLVSCADGGGVRLHRYWELVSAPHERTFAETAQDVRELLQDVVRRQLVAAGPYGAMLSGGVDSTSVAALAAAELRTAGRDPLESFCVRFEQDAEHFVSTELRPEIDAPYAAAAAEHIGTRHHTVTATMPDLLGVIPETRAARDLPGWGQFDASMYLLFREMASTCRVALTGEAADEIFAGYPYLFKPGLVARDGFPWLGDGPRLADCLSAELTAIVDPLKDERERYAQTLAAVPPLPGEDEHAARMRAVLFLGMSGPLAVILDRQERMSSAHGLQVRFPFCDHRLVQYLWNVPWSMKAVEGKQLLKTAMADLLPPATVARRKSAYPHVHDPRYEADLIDRVASILDDAENPVRWMFDVPRLRGLLDRIRAGATGGSLPGGASGPQLLIQLVEADRWITDLEVAIR